jgi:hypothetical protein
MELPAFDPFLLSLAEHDARMMQMRRARLEMNRLRHVSRAVHHRLRKAYYTRVRTLGLAPASPMGIEAKLLVLLRTHPDPELSELLGHYQKLKAEAHAATRIAADSERDYLTARRDLGTPRLADELTVF